MFKNSDNHSFIHSFIRMAINNIKNNFYLGTYYFIMKFKIHFLAIGKSDN